MININILREISSFNKNNMKIPTFKDLRFKDHPNNNFLGDMAGVSARKSLGHGRFCISVIAHKRKQSGVGGCFYGSVEEGLYEVAILNIDGEFVILTKHEFFNEAVKGWQTEDEINKIMETFYRLGRLQSIREKNESIV